MTAPTPADWQAVERALTGGYFVTGFWCDRCGDINFDAKIRECLTCTFPDDPCSRAYLEAQEPRRVDR